MERSVLRRPDSRFRGAARELAADRGEFFPRTNGESVAELAANRYRADLQAPGYGDGRHSFELRLPRPLSPFVLPADRSRGAKC